MMLLVWLSIPFFGAAVSGQSQCQVDLLFNAYLGDVSRTNFGTPCQAWSAQTPFRHAYTAASMFADGSVDAAHNYCRKTKETPLPWCYTTDIDHAWEFCDWMICQPPTQPCGGLLTRASGRITSPDLDEDGYYDDWVECFWTIRADNYKIIEITIVSLIMEFDFDGCLTDYLEAWEPHARLFKFCYISKEGLTMKTQYNELEVHFYADETGNQYGFELLYSQAEAPYCGGEVKGESGEFRPTGVDVYGHYDSNLNCTWFIRTSYYHEMHLLITILDIDVAEPCEDYLQIFQYLIEIFGYKEIVGKICAHSGNIDITSQTDLQIIFVTDDVNNENTGFVASFTQTLEMGKCWQGLPPKQYGGNIFVSDKGRICQSWSSQSPHKHTFTDLNFPIDGTIVDALNYCRNTIGKGQPFCLTTDPELEVDGCSQRICSGNPDCLGGHVTMAYNGNVSTTNHGFTCQAWTSKKPHSHALDDDGHYGYDGFSITSASNYCRAIAGDFRPWCYTTNPDVQWDYCHLRICRGYDQQCGGTLTKKSGIITSPDHDNNNKYDSYSICMWNIEGGPNSLTEMVFIFLNMLDSVACEKDYVMIFANGKEMSTHCGKALPQPIVTTATLTTIKFVSQTEDRSDSSNLAGAGQDETTGFKLKYKVVRFGEDEESASSTPTTTTSQATNHEEVTDRQQSTESSSKAELPVNPVKSTSPDSSPKHEDELENPSRATEVPTSFTTPKEPLPPVYTLRGSPDPTDAPAKTTWKWLRMETWSTAKTTSERAGTTTDLADIETTKPTTELKESSPARSTTVSSLSTVAGVTSVTTASKRSSLTTASKGSSLTTASKGSLQTTASKESSVTTASEGSSLTTASKRSSLTTASGDSTDSTMSTVANELYMTSSNGPYWFAKAFNESYLNRTSMGTSIRFTRQGFPGILMEVRNMLLFAIISFI